MGSTDSVFVVEECFPALLRRLPGITRCYHAGRLPDKTNGRDFRLVRKSFIPLYARCKQFGLESSD